MALLGVTMLALAVPTYIATPIGTFGQPYETALQSFGTGINASGHVTGSSDVPFLFYPHAYIHMDGTLRDLGTLGGASSYGLAINARGQVAGQSRIPDGLLRGFLYSNGAMIELGEPDTLSSATGINTAGQVAGFTGVSNGVRAFVYTAGSMTLLPTLGGIDTRAYGINDSGQVTGYATLDTFDERFYQYPRHAFIYSSGVTIDLGTLGGTNSVGYAINISGEVTGSAELVAGQYPQRAFLYSQGRMVDIGSRGVGDSIGYGINATGAVIGAAETNGRYGSHAIQHAFLYADGVMYDLNLLVSGLDGIVLGSAGGINDSGQIVADGYKATTGRPTRAYRLDPVGTAFYPPSIIAIEFYHATYDHYFLSIDANEIGDLDSGVHKGWVRTGKMFAVYGAAATGMRPVCRFYIPPAHGDSHFFSASSDECAEVLSKTHTDPSYSGYVHEAPAAFYVALPDVANGACPIGTVPIYRLWNARADSNHRYTTDPSVRNEMKGKGYVAEGYGEDSVAMCAPSA